MKKKDMQIIAHLRQNARMPLTDMSRKTHIPVSTIFDRLKANENELIVKHTTLLDFSKLGYNARANIAFKVDRNDKEAFREFLMKSPVVNSLYKVTNDYDFMVEAIFPQIKDMEAFLEEIELKFKVESKKAFFVIEDLKKEAFMSNPNLIFDE